MKPIQRILVPVDFSEQATTLAVRYAVELAQSYSAELVLMHVFQTDRYVLPERHILPSAEALEQIAVQLDLQLASMEKEISAAGTQARRLLCRGAAIPSILTAAHETRADLIVMGTHGRTGLKHMWIGSVAENIVRAAQCPVLTVRAASDGK